LVFGGSEPSEALTNRQKMSEYQTGYKATRFEPNDLSYLGMRRPTDERVCLARN
jgi:hypothetical protein